MPNYGEALAVRLAVSLATSINLENFIIEGDSQVVIMSLQHPQNMLDWRISHVVSDH
jgi:ribonuclease HI